jgi:RNA exonuclease 4
VTRRPHPKSEAALDEATKAKYVAMDCEMVGIGADGKQSVLARVSLVNWNGQVLLDTYVQVPTRVTDFRTWVSGVRPQHIRASTGAMDVKQCRETVAALLNGKIVVGHALRNDFNALMLTHPRGDIRDTARYRRFQRFGGNKWRPRKLRDLVQENLNRVIQEEGHSHNSVDDATAAMDLFKLAREAWEKELELKTKKHIRNRS